MVTTLVLPLPDPDFDLPARIEAGSGADSDGPVELAPGAPAAGTELGSLGCPVVLRNDDEPAIPAPRTLDFGTGTRSQEKAVRL